MPGACLQQVSGDSADLSPKMDSLPRKQQMTQGRWSMARCSWHGDVWEDHARRGGDLGRTGHGEGPKAGSISGSSLASGRSHL